jgi:DNA ligase D, 3''-phosphoesterase domain
MSKKLARYQQKRDFNETSEPSGQRSGRNEAQPIFVVQKHHASRLHYDFRLEMEGVLKSWAIPKGPSYDPSVKRLAMMTEDHPYDYASFEGVIPEGNYGAGNVIIWDHGTWELIEPGDDPVKALGSGKLSFRLNGRKLFGEWALVHTRGRSERDNEWLLLKHRDQYASADLDVTVVAPRSVVSNLEVDEIGAEQRRESTRKASSRKPRLVAGALRSKAPAGAKRSARPKAPKKA